MEGEAQVTTSEPANTPAPVTESTPQETSSESQVQNNNTDVSHETPSSTKLSGFDRVEFTPEQQDRINRLYGNMKRYETDAKELREYNQRLIEAVNNLSTGQQQIVSHLQASDFSDAESRLQGERNEAWQKGDYLAFTKANDQLVEIKIKKDRAELQKPAVQQPPQQPRNIDGRAVAQGALQKGAINENEAAVLNSWMGETDQSGGFKRSWINANDPRNYEASKVADAVLNSPMFVDKPLAEKLKEIDRRMGVQVQNQTAQSVLPAGNLTRGKPISNIKLDPKIEDVAVRLKFAGKDPKFTAQDHINAWKKAVAKSQGGTR